jgi:glycerol-3-phosphate dehydrogenase (NAD(P)+)
MAEGMGFGDNTRATIITRGLAEMSRLGIALGGDALTFSGLAGMGDLIATCSSSQSRNNTVGRELGKGRTITEITQEMNQVAEGVKSSRSVLELSHRHGVDMPIAEQVVAVCHDGATAVEAMTALMRRSMKPEIYGIS